jgi:hypothetical protein
MVGKKIPMMRPFLINDTATRALMAQRLMLAIAIVYAPSLVFSQGPPINSDTPILLGLEGKGVMLRTVLTSKSRLYQDGERVSDPFDRSVVVTEVPIAIPYNLTTNLLVGVIAPIVSARMKSSSVTSNSFGLSDVSLFGKYVLIQVDALQETFRVVAKAGLKLPTGDSNVSPALGTGATDYSLGTAGAWIGSRVGVYGDVSYSLNGSSDGYNFGDVFSYNVAVGIRLAPAIYETYPATQWNSYIELNGLHSAKDKSSGVINQNTGGHVLLLSPGIQYIPNRIFLLETSFQFPLVQSLNGTQLGTDFSLNLGTRLLLY